MDQADAFGQLWIAARKLLPIDAPVVGLHDAYEGDGEEEPLDSEDVFDAVDDDRDEEQRDNN